VRCLQLTKPFGLSFVWPASSTVQLSLEAFEVLNAQGIPWFLRPEVSIEIPKELTSRETRSFGDVELFGFLLGFLGVDGGRNVNLHRKVNITLRVGIVTQ
jgi:hypothetical protein